MVLKEEKDVLGILVVTALLIMTSSSAYAITVLLSDQGSEVKNSTGEYLVSGNLTIDIYDASTGGNTIYSNTFTSNISNGSWNIMISPNLEFAKSYWKDYEINGNDLNFSGADRIEFQSPLGPINNASFFNITSIVTGNITATNLTVLGNASIYGNLTVSGNITAAYFIGDGSGLTGITATATETDPSLYSNFSRGFSSDIYPYADLIQSIGSATRRWFQGWFKNLFAENVTINGNLTVFGNTTLIGNLNASGNITARYFYGNISTANFPHSSCSGTDKVTAISSTGVVTCDTDQTGGSSTVTRWFNHTNADTSSSSVAWQELFRFATIQGQNYTYDCLFNTYAALSTTGLQLNFNLTGGNSTYWSGAFIHSTAVNTINITSCSGGLQYCTDFTGRSPISSLTAGAGAPTDSYGRIIGASSGHLNISFRSETAGSAATIKRGSYCEFEIG